MAQRQSAADSPKYAQEFDVAQDFHDARGNPATMSVPERPSPPHQKERRMAIEGIRAAEIDTELSIDLAHLQVSQVSVNAVESLIALAVGHNIHIYALDQAGSQEPLEILQGHLSLVDVLIFHPTLPNVLVSCAMNVRWGSAIADPIIHIWSLASGRRHDAIPDVEGRDLSVEAANSTYEDLRTSAHAHKLVAEYEEAFLSMKITNAVRQTFQDKTKPSETLNGRLCRNSSSRAFDSQGRRFAYLPGEAPARFMDEPWDIAVFDTVLGKDRLRLEGHRDLVVWVGFSPDDKYIASVSCDNTWRFWNNDDGTLLRTITSEREHFTGDFSRDSRLFAAVSDYTTLWVYDLEHGIETISQSLPPKFLCKSIDWSDDGGYLVIGGGEDSAVILIYDIKGQAFVQTRTLIGAAKPSGSQLGSPQSLISPTLQSSMTTFARYIRDEETFGRKIVHATRGDNAVEIYDLDEDRKWRTELGRRGKRGWEGPVFVLEERGIVAVVCEGVVRCWNLPRKAAEDEGMETRQQEDLEAGTRRSGPGTLTIDDQLAMDMGGASLGEGDEEAEEVGRRSRR